LSAISINFFVFQRLSIPLTARFIGPAEAGLLSLGINTIANNLSQVLFNVARPILIPVASRIRFDRLSASRASLLLNVDAIYSITVGLVTVPIIASLPTLIGVWLGGEHDELVLPAQILVAGAALNVAFNVRRALMVGQGLAGPLARASLLCGAIGLVGLYWALIVQPSWPAIAGVVAVVGGTSSAIGAGIAFDRAALLPGTRSAQRGLRTIGVLLVSIAAAFAASRFAPTGLDPTMVFPPIVGAATILLMGHVALIPLATVFDTLKRLRAGAERPLFEDAAGPDS
jgi:O-antigen/teichoic acid export membrane protein